MFAIRNMPLPTAGVNNPPSHINHMDTEKTTETALKIEQQKINELCREALKEVRDKFNNDNLLIRVLTPGSNYMGPEEQEERPLNSLKLSSSGILDYIDGLATKGEYPAERMSASLVVPYAAVPCYGGSNNQFNGVGIVIASPEKVLAAGIDDLNSVYYNGILHCPESAKGRGIDYVAEQYKTNQRYSQKLNEIILGGISKEEFKGIFVYNIGNGPAPGRDVAAALWNQQEAFNKHGVFIPIYVYQRFPSFSHLSLDSAEIKLLTREEADISLKNEVLSYVFCEKWVEHLQKNKLLPEESAV